MEIFSIICLVIILFGIQHLLSWFWRKNYKEEGLLVLGVMLTILSLLITSFGIYFIIVWGKKLI